MLKVMAISVCGINWASNKLRGDGGGGQGDGNEYVITYVMFLYENCCILIQTWLKFAHRGSVNNKLALIQIMAWHRRGDKAPSESMMDTLRWRYYVYGFTDTYMCHSASMVKLQIIVCHADVFVARIFMMTSSNGNIVRVTGHLCGNSPVPVEFTAQRPVTRSFDVFFDLRLNKRLSKQSWGWLFETLSRPLWRHRNVSIIMYNMALLYQIIFCNFAYICIYIYIYIYIYRHRHIAADQVCISCVCGSWWYIGVYCYFQHLMLIHGNHMTTAPIYFVNN